MSDTSASTIELFSEEWALKFMEEWNADPKLGDKLAEIHFKANICYGFKEEPSPIAILVVEEGKVVRAGKYAGEDITWDLRASRERWGKWVASGMTMTKMAGAYMKGQIKFVKGDYGSMISNPKMAGPFVHSFDVMGRVK
jgi:hypothetical protein